MKCTAIATSVALLLALMNVAIKRETAQQEIAIRASQAKNCPIVWEHMEQIRALGKLGREAIRWCPEA